MSQIKNSKIINTRHKKSVWAIILNDGQLTCKGPGYGTWGTKEIKLAASVTDFWAGASSLGPAILYQVEDNHYVKKLRFDTGQEIVGGKAFSGIPTRVVVDPHEYAVNFFVTLDNGKNLYVYVDGWGKMKIE